MKANNPLSQKIQYLIDTIVFIGLILLNAVFYTDNNLVFIILAVLSMVYVIFRKPDINTITLVCIVIFAEVASFGFVGIPDNLDNYQIHGRMVLINLLFVVVINFRPELLARNAPEKIRNHPDLMSTHQDMMMTLLFALQLLWQMMQLLEHMIRHAEDFGFGELFGIWKPMFFYEHYKDGQFIFSILIFLVLYLMTFDKSKRKYRDI